jgi:hypothetical protein
MFNDNFLDPAALHQFEKLLKLGAGIAHTRANFFKGRHHGVLLDRAVGLQSGILSSQIAFGFLFL